MKEPELTPLPLTLTATVTGASTGPGSERRLATSALPVSPRTLICPLAGPKAVGAKVTVTVWGFAVVKPGGLTENAGLLELKLNAVSVLGMTVNVSEALLLTRTFPKFSEVVDTEKGATPRPVTLTARVTGPPLSAPGSPVTLITPLKTLKGPVAVGVKITVTV